MTRESGRASAKKSKQVRIVYLFALGAIVRHVRPKEMKNPRRVGGAGWMGSWGKPPRGVSEPESVGSAGLRKRGNFKRSMAAAGRERRVPDRRMMSWPRPCSGLGLFSASPIAAYRRCASKEQRSCQSHFGLPAMAKTLENACFFEPLSGDGPRIICSSWKRLPETFGKTCNRWPRTMFLVLLNA
jgi:hypothetical protein